jgi:phosphoglycolate phosphatase-like HAD superfamily hydrolase
VNVPLAVSRLLLFDIDGTLMISRGSGLRAMRAAVRHVFSVDTPEVSIRPHGKTDPILFEELATAYGVPLARLESVMQDLVTIYATHLEIGLREENILEVKPGVIAVLDALHERPDVSLGLVTGNLERTAWLKLEAAGLASYFETGGFGSDARDREGLVQHALQRFEAQGIVCERHATWVIGDTPDDVRSGRHHGTRTLAVATGSHDEAALRRSRPDVLLPDLSDVERVVDVLCGDA